MAITVARWIRLSSKILDPNSGEVPRRRNLATIILARRRVDARLVFRYRWQAASPHGRAEIIGRIKTVRYAENG